MEGHRSHSVWECIDSGPQSGSQLCHAVLTLFLSSSLTLQREVLTGTGHQREGRGHQTENQ